MCCAWKPTGIFLLVFGFTRGNSCINPFLPEWAEGGEGMWGALPYERNEMLVAPVRVKKALLPLRIFSLK